jgi:hypothetical protein
MSTTTPQAQQQCFANLNVLRRELEEMAVMTKPPASTEREQHQEVQEPVLVIRGK